MLKSIGKQLPLLAVFVALSLSSTGYAQNSPTAVIFEDDFESNEIDETKYQAANPFFEGGQGDIHAEAGNGAMRFVGTTTQRWWSGGTLRIVPTFAPSESQKITLSIDRVEEAGQGTASRSALWIFNEDETKYILFADVRGEQGWRYNRKIGEAGDVPTGGGTNINAFNGAAFDDGGLHRMSMVADGSTVKLLLDGIEGAEVDFPFSPVIFHFGSYARANNDTADTTWDNLVIESEGSASFLADTGISVRENALSPPVTVRIPPGLNSQRAISLTIVSRDPNIAAPEGGANGRLELTFPAAGENTATFRVAGNSPGGTQFRIESDDVNSANVLAVAVISGPGLLLEENFTGNSINNSKWQISEQGFGNAEGDFTVEQTEGRLKIDGFPDTPWAGASLKTTDGYLATEDLNLVFEGYRISINPFGGSARSGVFIANGDRSRYVFFSQLIENGDTTSWRVNVNPGSPTGAGTVIDAFSEMTEQNIGHVVSFHRREKLELNPSPDNQPHRHHHYSDGDGNCEVASPQGGGENRLIHAVDKRPQSAGKPSLKPQKNRRNRPAGDASIPFPMAQVAGQHQQGLHQRKQQRGNHDGGNYAKKKEKKLDFSRTFCYLAN